MLPEWDFDGDEANRRAFIEWVWAELDRFAMLVTLPPPVDVNDWTTLLVPDVKRSVGRPGSALSGTNGMVWDYLLLRYMFARYWPGKRRREDDSASAISIAVGRNVALPPGARIGDLAHRTIQHEERTKLIAELKRGLLSVSTGPGRPRVKSLGRVQAEADIATLESLPANRFAK